MNMAKKQNSFSSTKRDRNGETVPAIAGVEICGWPRKLDNLTWCKMPVKLT